MVLNKEKIKKGKLLLFLIARGLFSAFMRRIQHSGKRN